MAEYINRDILIKNIEQETMNILFTKSTALKYIREAPAADVAPVRHGRWTPTDYTGDCCYTCSECGFERDAYLLDVGNYCPNCGCCILGGGEDDTVSDKQ